MANDVEAHADLGPDESQSKRDKTAAPAYTVKVLTEESDPTAALRARQIHAESFIHAGYLKPSAIQEDGTLTPILDPSRGPDVTYFLASSIDATRADWDQATARLVAPSAGTDFRSLRAYQFTATALASDTRNLIESHSEQHGGASIREVAALAKTIDAAPLASFTVIREMVRFAVTDPTPQLWLAVLVPRPFAALRASFGESVVRQVGEPIPGYKDNPSASPDLRFIPAIIAPNQMLDSMLHTIGNGPAPLERARVDQTLRFVAAGLPRLVLSAAVAAYLEGTVANSD